MSAEEQKKAQGAMPPETYALIARIIAFIDDEDQKMGQKRREKNQP